MIFFTLAKTREDSNELRNSLATTSPGNVFNVLIGAKSFAHGYNKLFKAQQEYIKDDNILCFLHTDARLHFDFNKVIPEIFKKLNNPGIVGFVGTTKMTLDGRWWLLPDHMHGSFIQFDIDDVSKPNTSHGEKFKYFKRVESIDGYCLFVKAKVFKDIGMFSTYLDGFHLYDADICLKALKKGYNNYVVNELSQHFSGGSLDNEWVRLQIKFIMNWKDRI